MSEVSGRTAARPGQEPFTSAAADRLAARLLGDLRTRLGGLHIAHARRVAERVRPLADDRAVAAALLHDVVEKRRISRAELQAFVQDEGLVNLIDILTHRDAESEEAYLARCAADPVALVIKRADLEDKHFHGDAQVDRRTARRLSREAQQRLAFLELAAGSESSFTRAG